MSVRVKDFILNKGWLVGVAVVSLGAIAVQEGIAQKRHNSRTEETVSCTVGSVEAYSDTTVRLMLSCGERFKGTYTDNAKVIVGYIRTKATLTCRVSAGGVNGCEVPR